jgi:hypothetical protein
MVERTCLSACIVLHPLRYRLLQRVVLVELWCHTTKGHTGGNTRMMINTENQNKYRQSCFFHHDFHTNSSGNELENSQLEAKHGIIKICYIAMLKRYWNGNNYLIYYRSNLTNNRPFCMYNLGLDRLHLL